MMHHAAQRRRFPSKVGNAQGHTKESDGIDDKACLLRLRTDEEVRADETGESDHLRVPPLLLVQGSSMLLHVTRLA